MNGACEEMEEEDTETLLSRPTAADETFQKMHIRGSCSYENLCRQFRLAERDYVTQYAHIYFTRLETMRPHLEKAAVKKWGGSYSSSVDKMQLYTYSWCELGAAGDSVEVKRRVLDARSKEKCCVIGTLFKKMELKPNILKEISTNV